MLTWLSMNQPTLRSPPTARLTAPQSLACVQTSDRSATLRQIVEVFAAQTPQLLAQMRRGLDDNQPALVAEIAHKLKGSSATLAACQMVERCSELQTMAAAGSLAGAATLLDDLDAAFGTAYAALLDEVK